MNCGCPSRRLFPRSGNFHNQGQIECDLFPGVSLAIALFWPLSASAWTRERPNGWEDQGWQWRMHGADGTTLPRFSTFQPCPPIRSYLRRVTKHACHGYPAFSPKLLEKNEPPTGNLLQGYSSRLRPGAGSSHRQTYASFTWICSIQHNRGA